MNNLPSYAPLEASLKEKLPESTNDRELLRQMIAVAESYGIIVSQHRRALLSQFETTKAQRLEELKKGIGYDDDGNWVQTEALAEEYKSAKAPEKEIMLDATIATAKAELEYVTSLEDLIKRRCSVGQSMLNSLKSETSSSFNN